MKNIFILGRLQQKIFEFEAKNNLAPTKIYLGALGLCELREALSSLNALAYRPIDIEKQEILGLKIYAVDTPNHFNVTI